MRRISAVAALSLFSIAAWPATADDMLRDRFGAHRSHAHRTVFETQFVSRFQQHPGFHTFRPFVPYLTDGYAAPAATDLVSPPPVALAPPPPRRSAADERLTVEMTPSGVQIVRGPGTRHTGW